MNEELKAITEELIEMVYDTVRKTEAIVKHLNIRLDKYEHCSIYTAIPLDKSEKTHDEIKKELTDKYGEGNFALGCHAPTNMGSEPLEEPKEDAASELAAINKKHREHFKEVDKKAKEQEILKPSDFKYVPAISKLARSQLAIFNGQEIRYRIAVSWVEFKDRNGSTQQIMCKDLQEACDIVNKERANG